MTYQRAKILAIDDTPANLMLLGTALATEFDLQTATSGAMGLALALATPPDLILLDVMMPGMDGFETCQRIKDAPSLKNIPLIFVTAMIDQGSELKGLALGADDYLTKPINVDIARLRIRNLLERDRLRLKVGESEARWRATLEASPVPMAVNDDQQNIVYLNTAFIRTFGYTLADLPTLSHWWPQAYPDPAYRESVQTQWRLHMEKSRQDNAPFEPLELQVVDKDRVAHTLLIGFAPVGHSYEGAHLVTFYDISERKKLEATLHKTSEFKRVILDSMSAQIAVLDRDGIIVQVNEPWRRFALDNDRAAELSTLHTEVGVNYLKICQACIGHGQEGSRAAHDGILNVLQGRLPLFTLEYPCHAPHEQRWFSMTATPLGPEIGGAVVAHTNITTRKQAEILLQNNERLLRSVLDGIPDPVVLKDAQGNFLLGNQTLATLYNTTPEALLGKHDGDFGVPPDMADLFRENVLAIMAQGESMTVYEDSRNAVTGEIRHYRSLKKPLKDAQGHNQILVVAQDITDILNSQQLVAESERRLQAVLDATREGIWDWHLPTNQVIHNRRWYETLGLMEGTDPDTVEAFAALIHPEDKADVWQRLDAMLKGQSEAYYSEHRLLTKNGAVIWVQDRGRIVERDAQGQPMRAVGSFSDITERRQSAEKLQLAASVFSNSREGITITAADGTILDVNDAFSRITGYSRGEVIGQNPRLLSSGRQGKEFYATLWRSLLDKGHWYGEIWNRRKNGEVYAEMLSISAVQDPVGNDRRYVALFSDITRIKEHEQQLEHIAHFDALTGLPNRVLLADRLHQGMAQAQRRNQQLGVVFLDLDGFKAINDQYGHEAGDRMLITLADRMKQALRDGDTMARIGGDEFVAVMIDLDDVDACVPMINRLLAAASQPMQFGEHQLQVSASLGVTFYPQADNIEADQLLRQADQAMYQAKLAGKNRYHLFDAAHDRSVRGHHESLERIRLALAQNEFVLYYQPKVNMRTGEVIGAEALIRWQHPVNGLLPPAVFLPVIEDHPLAVDIGEWVIGTALTQMAQWQSVGLDIPVSVNIGARQLQQPDFVTHLQALLAAHPGVKPSCLELEVLETSALEDLARVSQVIEACRGLGVMFALDDFGTGYSSLAYLKRLQVTQLKIDQTFVRDMLDDPDDLAILEAVLGLARAFRLQVIAEGVETLEHGEILLQLGCELAQGYGIARPMPAHQLPAWATSWQPDRRWLNLPCIHPDKLPLLFASVEHRAWVLNLSSHLKGERALPPPLDHHQCRFGHWMDTEGLARHGDSPAYQAIAPLHRGVHALAGELCETHNRGLVNETLGRLEELYALRDALLAQLNVLLAEK